MDLEWGAPPPEAMLPPRVAGGFYGTLAKMLRERPNEWAVMPREYASVESARSAAANIRNGRVRAMPAGHFEVAVHEKTLWIRYDEEGAKKAEAEAAEKPAEEPAAPRQRPEQRRAGGRPRYEDDGSADEDDRKAYPARVRAWATLNRIEVPKHGRLPNELMERYSAATGDPRPGA
jgi:hypothetical protein